MNDAARNPSWEEMHYGLWSLWDMQELKAQPFLNAVRALAEIEGVLGRLPAQELREKIKANYEALGFLTSCLEVFAEACVGLGADVSKMAADELREKLGSGEVTYAVLHEEVRHLHKYFERHLSSAKLLALNPDDAKFYDGAIVMFGDDVVLAFGSAMADIEEAGKCLALGRPAAAMFHLMRVVEIGLRCVAKPLGIPGPKPDWGEVIRAVDDYLKLPKAQRTLPLDDAFLSGVSAHMHAVKLAWRNQVMHVDTTFGPENARDIFNATKALMQHLSTQLSE